ncbi:amidohydrolase family protein [Desulfurococcaceae archaeon MEX13E-LK6-19]|nr:amidohydrolase family protein [Desulfurococcaceae archaeon MEX13E-LK6-19]
MSEKVSLIIKNGIVVTMDPERRVFDEGYVVIDGDRIVEVGKGDPGDKYHAEEVIDARRGVIVPGFICVHTHLYGALLRASTWFAKIDPPTDFQQNLQRIWWPVDEMLTHEDAYASALIASMEFARTGTTLFFDTYSGPNSIDKVLDREEEAVNKVGIRGILAFEATERHSKKEGIKGLKENERFIKKNNADPSKLVKGAISLHASFTVSDELFIQAREMANKYKALLTIHVEEGLIDVYHNIERYGVRPIERMEKLGFLGPDVVMAHVVQAIDDELKILKKYDVKVAHNAMSNMLNAVGVAPVPKMLDMGITVGIGNDGYIFDVFENMRTTYLIHKVALRDPRVMPPQKVVEMATIDAAKVLGLEKELGSLEPGKKADIVIIKPEYTPTPVRAETVYGHLVNTFNGRDVDTVIVNGKVIVRDRKLLTVDMEKEMEYVHKVAWKLWERLLSKGEYQLDVLRIEKPSWIKK